MLDVADHHVRLANRAAQEACQEGAATCYAMIHRQDSPCHSPDHPCPIEMIKETGKPTVVEHVGHDASGAGRNIEVHAFPVFDAAGTLKYVVEHLVDITAQRQAEVIQQHFRALFESVPVLISCSSPRIMRSLRRVMLTCV